MKLLRLLKGHKMDLKTKSKPKVTVFAMPFIALVSCLFSVSSIAANAVDPIKPSHKKQITDYKLPEAIADKKTDLQLSATVEVSRGTNLYDFNDGSRGESLDVLVLPTLTTSVGTFSIKEVYSKNLKNEDDVANGFSDASIIYGLKAKNWEWSPPYILTMKPSFTVIAPLSDVSIKKNRLQTALSAGLSFGIKPDGLAAETAGAWNVTIAATAGRSFHTYEEDINGAVLNKYSSNQTLALGYTIFDWSFSFDYTNRSRWTYQNNIKQSFVITEEISYAVNENFYASVGHSNDAGSVLKANGFESNVQVIDENNSGVYLTLGSSF
jgi:hypothetical protein